MSRRMVTKVIDDVSGVVIPPDQVQKRRIRIDGEEREIDLTPKNSDRLNKDLAKWIAKARRVERKKAPASNPLSPEQSAAIRSWAKDQGYDIGTRGRIPSNVLQAYAAR